MASDDHPKRPPRPELPEPEEDVTETLTMEVPTEKLWSDITETRDMPITELWQRTVDATHENLPERAPRLAAGQRVGPYTLIAPIGRGGMAIVWAAWRPKRNGGREAAVVKTLLPMLALDHDFVRMFLDEVKLLAEIRHPNVVSVRDVGTHEGTPYVAIEWVDGDSLSAMLTALSDRGKEMPLSVALRIVGEACLGLHNAHELRDPGGELLGVVHRDVSPANILLSTRGDVKLIDFGVAKAVSRLASTTRTGVLKGKISYMAPEQVTKNPIDRRADIWAAGVVLYRLVAGRLPYQGGMVDVLMKIRDGQRMPALPAGTPHQIIEIIHSALARDPNQRFQTAADLRRAIQFAYAEVCTPMSKAEFGSFVDGLLGEHVRERREMVRRALEGE